jgi:hypothetical protein
MGTVCPVGAKRGASQILPTDAPATASRSSVSHKYAPNSAQVSRDAGNVAISGGHLVWGAARRRLVQASRLPLLRYPVQRFPPLAPHLLLIGKQVRQQAPAMPATLVVRDLAVRQQAHQGWTRDAEVSGLLGGSP